MEISNEMAGFTRVVSRVCHTIVDSDTRGILTDADKEWLRGEKDYNQRQTEAKRRQQIRERVALALQDFQLLAEEWSTEEMEKVMDEIDAESCAEDIIEFLAPSQFGLELSSGILD